MAVGFSTQTTALLASLASARAAIATAQTGIDGQQAFVAGQGILLASAILSLASGRAPADAADAAMQALVTRDVLAGLTQDVFRPDTVAAINAAFAAQTNLGTLEAAVTTARASLAAAESLLATFQAAQAPNLASIPRLVIFSANAVYNEARNGASPASSWSSRAVLANTSIDGRSGTVTRSDGMVENPCPNLPANPH